MEAGLHGALTHKFGRRMARRLPDWLCSSADYTIGGGCRQVGELGQFQVINAVAR